WCGDADGRLLRWECCTGARTERRVDGPIETLGLDAHDHVLATGQATCVRLWDADTLAPRAELPIDAPSLLVRCSPDGTRVAAGTFDGALSLWDVPERALLVRQRLARPTTAVEPPARYAAGNVTALAFSPDGESLAVGLRDGRIALLDADGDVLWTRDEHTRLVRHLDWSPDGRRLCAAGRDLRATIWSVEGALIANLPHPADVREVAWRDDGALVVTAAFDGGLRLFDAQGTARGELTGHEDSVYGVAFAQGGDRLWSYSGDRTVRQWPCGSALADALPVHAWCLAVAFAGRRLVAGDVFGQVTFFDFDRAGEPDRAHLELHGNVRNIAVAPRGDLLACGMLGGDVALLDPGEPRVVARFRAFEADVTSVAFSGDGALLAVGAATGALRAFSVATREALAEVCSGGPAVREIAALPGDGFVAVDAAGDLLVCAGARIVRRFPGAAVNPEAVTVDPTGTLAAVGSGAGDVLLLDLSRGTVLRTLRGHDQTVTALAFLPDRSRLVSAARDATVRVWDPGREDSLVVLRCGISPMHAIAISPDGRRIAASGEDDVVRTWCAADAR
ncbi:MAG TPA: hypothetical protein VK081_09435, partial [Planctomycetota bacterium]|nr:hypothetical protein [Planctomycetota bacterium]